ncbi:MAG TPA: amidohydrolase family protein [bacterium]|nr:amidohydrolase family protein [bacterium]HOL67187.1 amidohydrolase family protein [bacterium]
MRIIDAHNHPDWHGYDLSRFIANMDACSIEKTWLLSWECPRDEYADCSAWLGGDTGPIPFARCLSYGERAPERFILGYAPDPRRPDAIDRMQAAVEIYGVKVCGELKVRMMYDNWDALKLYRFCGERKIPVTVHLDYAFSTGQKYPRPDWWYGGGIEAFERALSACPETVFLGHGPGFWAHISGDELYQKEVYPGGSIRKGGKLIKMLRKYPNLYCDLSGGSGWNALHRDPKFAREFLMEFPDRILYARDYFDNRHQQLLNSLGLPEKVLARIYYQNALKLVPEEKSEPNKVKRRK